jgi:hypothetical protein
VEVEVVEVEEAVAVEEEMDEAVLAEVPVAGGTALATLEVMQQSPQVAVAMPDSPEVVAVVMGPEPVVVPEAEAEARVGNSARFCGSKGICPGISNPYP